MRFRVITFLLASGTAACAASVLEMFVSLTTDVSTTTEFLNTVQGGVVCNFRTTTQAISQDAAIAEGSACRTADTEASKRITAISTIQQSLISQLRRDGIPEDHTQVIAKFQSYATEYYALFNALDLWECRIVATPASKTHAAVFDSGNNLRDGFNSIVAELSQSPDIALQIAGTNLKQQTHFGGTFLLATQVHSPKPVALAACKIITAIVEAEGGGVGS